MRFIISNVALWSVNWRYNNFRLRLEPSKTLERTMSVFYSCLKTRKRTLFAVLISVPTLASPVLLKHEDYSDAFLRKFSGSLMRFARSIAVGVRISIMYKWQLLGIQEDSPEYANTMQKCHQRAADMILRGCIKNGGLYIKMGQGLASLNHVLPKEYTTTLEALHDRAIARSKNEVDRIFIADFGAPPSDLFIEFDHEPFAAASLAQVHRAVTRSGERVAVKVQYEDLRDRFHTDIATLEFLLRIVEKIHKNFGFAWVLKDLKHTLAQELDFELEAENAMRCRQELAAMGTLLPNGQVHIPRVHHGLTSKRVLTAEFIDGIKINQTETLKSHGFSLRTIDRILVEAFGRQVFCTGFVHADPHPGNLLIRQRPLLSSDDALTSSRRRHAPSTIFGRLVRGLWSWLSWCARFGRPTETPAQLVILDHGLYESLPDEQRLAVCQMYKSVVDNDEARMQTAASLLGVNDWSTFGEVLIQRPWRRKGITISTHLTESERAYLIAQAQEHFDRIMLVLREMPRPMLLFIRNLNLVRSICRSHGDPINRHEMMIYTALLGSRIHVSNQQASPRLASLLGWIQWRRYTLQIRVEALREWIFLHLARVLYLLGLAPDIREIQSIIAQQSGLPKPSLG
nr:unnamed protein product [Spirometra erinaceieuropaei]